MGLGSSLQNICDVITDGDHQPPPQTNEGIPFLVIGNVRTGKLDFSNTRFVSKEYYENILEDRIPERGDILYTVVGTLESPCLLILTRTSCSSVILLYLSHRNLLIGYFFITYSAIQFCFCSRQLNVLLGQRKKLGYHFQGYRAIVIPFPSLKERKRILRKKSKAVFLLPKKSKLSIEINLNRAERLRQSILKKAFSGKLV